MNRSTCIALCFTAHVGKLIGLAVLIIAAAEAAQGAHCWWCSREGGR